MTDKQIIIDGVDVSGCEFFETKAQVMQCHIGTLTQRCKANNCYYKQLKRSEAQCEGMFVTHTDLEKKYKAKEQECETLASQLDFEVQKKECLERECERLKIERDSWEYQWEKRCEIGECLSDKLDQLKAENEELKKWKETAKDLFDKTCSCKYLNKENAHCSLYNKECVAINQCLYKNQQTLTEIKEIMKKHCRKCKKHKFYYFQLCCTCKYTDILQKISEVEDEQN